MEFPTEHLKADKNYNPFHYFNYLRLLTYKYYFVSTLCHWPLYFCVFLHEFGVGYLSYTDHTNVSKP